MRRFGWIVLLVLLVAAWEAWVRGRGIPDYLLPAPSDVGRALWQERADLASQALITARTMLAGYALALAAGLGAAIAMHRWQTLRRAAYPLLVASQSVPVVALAPLLVIYLGFGLAPKAVIVALVCFFPITVNALDGFASVDPDLPRMLRTLRATPRQLFWRVEFPWALPGVFSGARIAASYAAVAALFAEYAGGSGGLADSIRGDPLDTPLVGAAVVLLALLSLGLFGLVTLVERLALPGARESR